MNAPPSQAPSPPGPDAAPVLMLMINHHLGNFVVSLPFIEAIAAHFRTRPDVIVDHRYAPLAELLPSIGRVLPHNQSLRRKNGLRHAGHFLQTAAAVLRGRYRVVFDVGGGIQSVTLATLALAGQRIGLAKGRRNWIYTQRLPPDPGGHASDRFMPFMTLLGKAKPTGFRLRPREASFARIDRLLPASWSGHPLVVIHPGAGYEFRKWPRERFAAAADILIERHGARVVLLGAPGEETFLQETIGLLRAREFARPLVSDLDVVLALFWRAALLLSNESGPTHLAAATDVPIVTIFGPSKESAWRPGRIENTTMLRGQVCPPECRWGRCVDDLKCVMNVSVDDVIAAARHYLKA
jgi:ADP-heptose:LPS heptosyltransferase